MSWLLGQTAALLTVMFFIGAALGCVLRRTLSAPQTEAVLPGTGALAEVTARATTPAVAVARKVEPLPEVARAPVTPPASKNKFEDALTRGAATPAPVRAAPIASPVVVPVAEPPRAASIPTPAVNQTAVTPPLIQPRPAIAPGAEPVSIPPPPVMPAPVITAPVITAPVIAAPVITAPVIATPVAPVAPVVIPAAPIVTPVAPVVQAIAAALAPAAQDRAIPTSASVGAAAAVAAAAAASVKAITEVVAPVAVAPVAVAPVAVAPVAVAPVAVPAPTAVIPTAIPAAVAYTGPAIGAAAAAAAALGQTVVRTDATVPTGKTQGADDLRRIQGIDGGIAERLNGIGITRFAEIAKWQQADVQRAGETLGVRGRVERENWVEQAQILASGGDTSYSRRLAAGEVATTVVPAVTQVLSNKVLAAPAIQSVALAEAPTLVGKLGVEAATAATAAAGTAAAAAAAMLAAAAKSGADTARAAAVVTAVVPAAQPIAAAVPVIEKAVEKVAAAIVPTAAVLPRVEDLAAFAKPAEVKPAEVKPADTVAITDVLPSATPVLPAVQPMRDNLQRLSGVSGELEKTLNGQGVTRYSHLASWGKGDVERFDKLLGSDGRIARENWIEQAQMLGRGGDTAYSRDFDRRAIEAVRGPSDVADAAAARPSRLSDAIRGNTGGQPAASPARADMGALRSVKSDAYRPTAVDAATSAAAASAAASGSARVVRSAEVDDLKRIRGVGVLIERKLNSVGIVNYAQIGQWTNTDINKISQMLDFKGRIERENWVEQARILASGGKTEFSQRVDRGEVETSKSKE